MSTVTARLFARAAKESNTRTSRQVKRAAEATPPFDGSTSTTACSSVAAPGENASAGAHTSSTINSTARREHTPRRRCTEAVRGSRDSAGGAPCGSSAARSCSSTLTMPAWSTFPTVTHATSSNLEVRAGSAAREAATVVFPAPPRPPKMTAAGVGLDASAAMACSRAVLVGAGL